MALVNGRSDFDEQKFSKKVSISRGTDIFSLGGDYFTIKTNMEEREVRDLNDFTGDFSQPVTLEDINEASEQVTRHLDDSSLELNFDKAELTNYAYFGSLQDRFKFSILNIINKFPASVYVNHEYNDVLKTIIYYQFFPEKNLSVVKIPLTAITNNYNLKIVKTDEAISNQMSAEDLLKDLNVSFDKYELWDFNSSYKILHFTQQDNYVQLTVAGNPFPDYSASNSKINFHIKPNSEFYNEFTLKLSDLEKYLLNKDTSPKHTASFKVITLDANGNTILTEQPFTWKTTDGYNLDYNTLEFELYSEGLISLGQQYDDYKTNIIARQLISAPVVEFDSEDQRLEKLLKIYGKEFDEIKKYIDGLAHLSRVSYDKKDNIPDKLIKNFARTLGWGTFSTVDEQDLMKSFLSDDNNVEIAGLSKNLSPVETDIELWRRLVINSAYLFKSKTTRQCIEFLFKLIGAPSSLIEIQEYVYVAESKIEVEDNYGLPIDDEGYPKPLNTPETYFQMKGGWNSKKELAPTNSKNYNSVVGIHTGDYDNGNAYIDSFVKAGFKLKRVVDNRKAWAVVDGGISDEIKDHRLVINSKEITIYLTPSGYIDGLVLKYQNLSNQNTLLHNIDDLYASLVDPTTRKVMDFNGGYPALKKLYYDYIQDSGTVSPNDIDKYLQQINGFWLDLLEQFMPSTSIWQGGTLVKNTVMDRQKFNYKVGVNFGSEFEKEVTSYPDIEIQTVGVQGEYNPPMEIDVNGYDVHVTYISTLEFPDEDTDMNNSQSILKIKNPVEANSAGLDVPTVEVSGAVKIDENTYQYQYETLVNDGGGLKTIQFDFARTELFAKSTTFQYNIYKLDETSKTFNPTPIYTKNVKMEPFKTNNIPLIDQVLLGEGDYLLKCGYNIEVKFDNTQDSFIEHYLTLTINGIDSLINLEDGRFMFNTLILQPTDKYGIYNENDWWFTVIEAPSTPMIKNLYEKSDFASAQLVNQQLYVSADGQKVFVLEELPEGDIFFNINGSTLIKSGKRDYSDGGEFYLFRENDSVQIILREGIEITRDDVVTVIYLMANSDISFVNTGIIRKSDINLSEQTSFNGKSVYSYDMKYSLNTDIAVSELIVILNGAKLLRNDGVNTDYDYEKDPDDETKLLLYLNEELKEDGDQTDEIMIYYPKVLEDGYYIQDRSVHVSWTGDNTTDSGKFIVEIAKDRAFTNIILSAEEPFVQNPNLGYTEYNVYVGDVEEMYMTYYYRVRSQKENLDLLGRLAVTESASKIYTFKTDSAINI